MSEITSLFLDPDLAAVPFTVDRTTYRRTRGALTPTTQTLSAFGCIHPGTPEMIQLLPEEEKHETFIAIYTDFRLTTGENEETSIAELKALPGVQKADAIIRILDYAVPSWTGLVYPTKKYYPTWIIPQDSPQVTSAVKGFKDALGEDPVVSHWIFSTNGVSICGMFGIPCIGFGPGHEKFAHFPNEETDIEHLTRACAFYASLAIEYSKTPAPAK